MNGEPPSSPETEPPVEPQPSRSSSPEASSQREDPVARAESLKGEGNTAFREKNYDKAVDLYSRAIGTCNRVFSRDGYD